MSPNEIAILRIVAELGKVSKWVISRRMGVSSDYAGYLCDCLVKKACLEKVAGRYQLTPEGAEALLEVYLHIKNQLNTRIKRSHYLSDRVSKEMDKLASLVARKSEKTSG